MLRFPYNFQGKAHSVANAVTCAFNALGSPVACFLSGVVDLLARNLWHYLNESGEICRNEHTSPRILHQYSDIMIRQALRGRMNHKRWISIQTHKKFYRARCEFLDWVDRAWEHSFSCFLLQISGFLMFGVLGIASLLFGIGAHMNAFPELYRNDKKRRPVRFKYSLTLFVREKGWIFPVMFALLFVSVVEPFNPYFFTSPLLYYTINGAALVVGGLCGVFVCMRLFSWMRERTIWLSEWQDKYSDDK